MPARPGGTQRGSVYWAAPSLVTVPEPSVRPTAKPFAVSVGTRVWAGSVGKGAGVGVPLNAIVLVAIGRILRSGDADNLSLDPAILPKATITNNMCMLL